MASHSFCKHGDPLSYVFRDLFYMEIEYNGKDKDKKKKYVCMCYASDKHSRYEKLTINVDEVAKEVKVECETGGQIITMQISDMENVDQVSVNLHETGVAKKSRGYMTNETLSTRYLETLEYSPESLAQDGGFQRMEIAEDASGKSSRQSYNIMFCRPPFDDVKVGHVMMYNADMTTGTQKSKVSAKIEPDLDRASKILAFTLIIKLCLTKYKHMLEIDRPPPEAPNDTVKKLLRKQEGIAQEQAKDFKSQLLQKESDYIDYKNLDFDDGPKSSSSPIPIRRFQQHGSPPTMSPERLIQESSVPSNDRNPFSATYSNGTSSDEYRRSASPELVGMRRSPPTKVSPPHSYESSEPMSYSSSRESSPSSRQREAQQDRRERSQSPSKPHSPASSGSPKP